MKSSAGVPSRTDSIQLPAGKIYQYGDYFQYLDWLIDESARKDTALQYASRVITVMDDNLQRQHRIIANQDQIIRNDSLTIQSSDRINESLRQQLHEVPVQQKKAEKKAFWRGFTRGFQVAGILAIALFLTTNR